jgi:radical SAM protein with 4Fe4S-binding SPASM domain
VRGALRQERSKDIVPQKYERAIGRLRQHLRDGSAATYGFSGARIKAAQDILQRQLILRTIRERRNVIPCYAGKLNLVLTENGDLYPCEMRSDSFGNVRDSEYDLRAMLRTGQAERIRSSIRRGECHCTHECYFMTNILFNPRWYPALARELLLLRR